MHRRPGAPPARAGSAEQRARGRVGESASRRKGERLSDVDGGRRWLNGDRRQPGKACVNRGARAEGEHARTRRRATRGVASGTREAVEDPAANIDAGECDLRPGRVIDGAGAEPQLEVLAPV